MRKLIILVILLAGCAPKGPHWEYRCVKGHTQMMPYYTPPTYVNKVPVGGGMRFMYLYHCDVYDSTWISNEE